MTRSELFFELVKDELVRAQDTELPFNSLHEGYAVILEEVDELWTEVKSRPGAREPETILCELIQIAAMAGRMAVDLDLIKTAEEQE